MIDIYDILGNNVSRKIAKIIVLRKSSKGEFFNLHVVPLKATDSPVVGNKVVGYRAVLSADNINSYRKSKYYLSDKNWCGYRIFVTNM